MYRSSAIQGGYVMNKKPTTQKKKKGTGKKVIKSFIFAFLLIFLIASVATGGVVLAMIKTAPSLDINEFLKLDEITTLYDSTGKLMDENIASERRINIIISNVPVTLQDAFISIEDSRFKTHSGIDLKRLAGAVFSDIKIKIGGSDQSLQGASTITQQLVKYRMFLEDSMENRASPKRKIQEMSLAMQLEKVLTKPQILEAYMNTIFLGGNAHGVEAAAQQYFGKSITKLTLKQSAFIASAAQNPSNSYSLSYKSYKNKEIFVSARTKAVLENMYKFGTITKDQFDLAMAEDLKFTFSIKDSNKMNYEYFSRPVVARVAEDLMNRYNISKEDAYSQLMYNGLKIYTTMDRALQDASQVLIDDPVQANKKNSSDYIFPRNSKLKPTQADIQASCVIMDYHTGEVKTIIGGRGIEGPMSFNRAASNDFLKPPGSSIKPLTVYSPAIDSKIATASTIIEDSPLSEDVAKRLGGAKAPFNPTNLPLGYKGYLTLRDCLKHSINVAAVKIVDMISLKTSASYGEKFGLQLDKDDKAFPAAMALGQLDGGSSAGTNPLTMAAAYGVFGNNGMRTTPRLYTKVIDRTGKVILETKFQTTPVLSSQSAYIMYDLLSGPVSSGGTGPSANFSDMPVRGKTGTSSDSKNLWFVGLTPYYSAAVWIGTDKGDKKIEGMISNTAALLWGKIMKTAHKALPVKQVERPSGISSYTVSKDSGDIPTDLTFRDPRGNRSYSELFINGTQPTTLDSIHVEAQVTKDPTTGKYVLISEFTPLDKIETKVFIRRTYTPTVFLADSPYVLPIAVDTFSKEIIVPPVDPPVPPVPPVDPPVVPPVVPPVDPPVVPPVEG
jgi:penicillin-binding protein 1A